MPEEDSSTIVLEDAEVEINIEENLEEDDEHVENEEELCETCRWRDQHLAAVSAKQEKLAFQKKEESENVEKYLAQKRQADSKKEHDERLQKRQLAKDIHNYNEKVTESKIVADAAAVAKLNSAVAEDKNDSEDVGGYLLFRRPMTAEKDKQKQSDLYDDLGKQIEAKKQRDAAEKRLVQLATNEHHLQSKKNLDWEVNRERERIGAKKLEYRKNLEAQMAWSQLESDTKPEDLWWAKKPPVEAQDFDNKPTAMQVKRVAKQQAAYRNLEDYIKKQQEEDDSIRQGIKKDREEMKEKFGTHPDLKIDVGAASGARTARLKVAEEAWQKAHEENQEKKDHTSRLHQGGALMDQLSQYRRCKKCHKAIKGHKTDTEGEGKYWFNGDTNEMHRFDGGDYKTLGLRVSDSIHPKSRHMIF